MGFTIVTITNTTSGGWSETWQCHLSGMGYKAEILSYNYESHSPIAKIIDVPQTLTYEGIPYVVDIIGTGVFAADPNIESVSLPPDITRIGDDAFAMSALEHLTFFQNISSIGRGAFSHTSLRNISLPKNLRVIGERAFSNCGKLKQVEFPERLETIGAQAFVYDTQLESVVIPASVEWIGKEAFAYCKNLQTVTLLGRNTQFSSTAFDSHTEVISMNRKVFRI